MRQLADWEIGQAKNALKKEMEPAKREHQSSLPSLGGDSSLAPIALSTVVKRGRGRPRKTEAEKVAKAHKVLTKVAEDVLAITDTRSQLVTGSQTTELTITEPMFDGGGTAETSPTITKESLQRRVSRRLNVLDRYLTDERLLALMGESSLKEIGIYEGIMMDKSLVLQGQPTVIVGSKDREDMDKLLPLLTKEMRRRNLITTLSERKIEFQGTDS